MNLTTPGPCACGARQGLSCVWRFSGHPALGAHPCRGARASFVFIPCGQTGPSVHSSAEPSVGVQLPLLEGWAALSLGGHVWAQGPLPALLGPHHVWDSVHQLCPLPGCLLLVSAVDSALVGVSCSLPWSIRVLRSPSVTFWVCT